MEQRIQLDPTEAAAIRAATGGSTAQQDAAVEARLLQIAHESGWDTTGYTFLAATNEITVSVDAEPYVAGVVTPEDLDAVADNASAAQAMAVAALGQVEAIVVPELVDALPTDFAAYPEDSMVVLSTDSRLYVSTGSAWITAAGSGIASVGALPALPDAAYPQGAVVFLTADNKLYRSTGTAWSGDVSQADVNAAQAAAAAAQADASLALLRAPVLVSSLPALPDSSYPAGKVVILSAASANGVTYRLHRSTGTTWTAVLDGADVAYNSLVAAHIVAGAIEARHLNIRDASGAASLTGAGFGGSWLPFLHSFFYNSGYESGPLGVIDNVTAPLPYWTKNRLGAVAASEATHITLSGTASGRRVYLALNTTAAATGDRIEISQQNRFPTALPGRSGYRTMAFLAAAYIDNPASGHFVGIAAQAYNANGVAVGSEQVYEVDTTLFGFTWAPLELAVTFGPTVVAFGVRKFLRRAVAGGTSAVSFAGIRAEVGQDTVFVSPGSLSYLFPAAIARGLDYELVVDPALNASSAANRVVVVKGAVKADSLRTGGAAFAPSPLTNDLHYHTAFRSWFQYDGAAWRQTSVGEGTSFPSSPITGLRFHRADRNITYYYDGTRWLSVQLFRDVLGSQREVMPITASQTVFNNSLDQSSDIWIERYEFSFFVNGVANDATNRWDITLRKANQANTKTTVDGPWGTNTAGAMSNNHVVPRTVGATAGSPTQKVLELVATKVGTPGNLYCGGIIEYRKVG